MKQKHKGSRPKSFHGPGGLIPPDQEKRMHKITLTNSFHGTCTTVLVPDSIKDQNDAWWHIQWQANDGGARERRRLSRVRRALCPHSDCQCGGLRP